MITEGIHDIPSEVYESDPCEKPSLSSSIAKILLNESPLHAWAAHPQLNPNFEREDKEIFDLGTVAHALMLQGLSIAVVLEFDDWKKKEARIARDILRADGKIPILSKHWGRVQNMVTSGHKQLEAHREAKNAFTGGKPEQTLVWADDHGVVCRARLDWLHDSRLIIDDYKSTGMSVNPENLDRMMVSAGWDVQAAFYRRGIYKLFGKEAEFRFICQEAQDPHALSVVGVGPDFQWIGEKKVQKAIDLWAECTRTNKWPGYSDRITYPTLPPWVENKFTEQEMKEIA